MRLFIALGVPPVISERAFRLLPADLPGFRRVKPELMHLTLAFLGWTAEDRVAEAKDAVAAAGRAVSRFRLVFDRAGRFPDTGRPRVAWLGLSVGDDDVRRAGAAVRAELDRRGLAYDAKPLRAHLTLARVEEGIQLPEARAIASAIAAVRFEPMAMDVVAIDLMRSVLSPRGPRYTSLASSPLEGA